MRPAHIGSQEKHPGRTTEKEQDDEEIEYGASRARELGGNRSTTEAFSTDHLTMNTLINRANRFNQQAEAWKKGGEARNQAQIMLAIGKQIQLLRQAQRWTRADLAQHTALDLEHIFLLEHGLLTREEATTLLDEIALYFGIDNGVLSESNCNSATALTERGHRFSLTPEALKP